MKNHHKHIALMLAAVMSIGMIPKSAIADDMEDIFITDEFYEYYSSEDDAIYEYYSSEDDAIYEDYPSEGDAIYDDWAENDAAMDDSEASDDLIAEPAGEEPYPFDEVTGNNAEDFSVIDEWTEDQTDLDEIPSDNTVFETAEDQQDDFQEELTEDQRSAKAASETPADIIYHTTIEEAGADLREQIKERIDTIQVGFQTADSDYSFYFQEIYDEARRHTGRPTEGDYISFQLGDCSGTISVNTTDGINYVAFTYEIDYYTDAGQESLLDEAIYNLLNQLALDGKTDYEKVRSIYEYITSNVSYDYPNLYDEEYKLKYTAYAAQINRTAVCQGYSALFYRLALEAGLSARVVTGKMNEEEHAWNIVELDGLYYFIDASQGSENIIKEDFFLKGSINFSNYRLDNEYLTDDFVTYFPVSAFDYSNNDISGSMIATGYLTSEIQWSVFCSTDENGNQIYYLELQGMGTMPEYTSDSVVPWEEWRSEIELIKVGNGITSIGSYIFSEMASLNTVQIPSTVTSIGSRAFFNCEGLTNLQIPGSVTVFGEKAIGGNYGDIEWEYVPSDKRLIISGSGRMGEPYAEGSASEVSSDLIPWHMYCSIIEEVVVEEGVTNLGTYAFINFANLTKVTLPSTLAEIGEASFENCYSLTSICIPDNVMSISHYAFRNCVGLRNIHIPDSVSYVGVRAFCDCSRLFSFFFYGDAPSFENQAVMNSSAIAVFYARGSSGWSSVQRIFNNVIFAEWDPGIYDGSGTNFDGESIKGAASGRYGIGIDWYYEEETTELIISGTGAMQDPITISSTDDLGFVTTRYSTDAVEWAPFRQNITSVEMSGGITSISMYAFYWMIYMKEITIPDTVAVIGDSAFSYCYNLQNLTMGEMLTSIGSEAFKNCSSLKKIYISNHLNTVDVSAFSGCTGLTDVYYGGSEAEWDQISIGEDNECLTNATIHFNCSGIEPSGTSLQFEHSHYICNYGDSIPITAVYTSEHAPDIIEWASSNESAVSFSGSSTQGPSVTGLENTYWISTDVTGLAFGEYDITLSVDGQTATFTLDVTGFYLSWKSYPAGYSITDGSTDVLYGTVTVESDNIDVTSEFQKINWVVSDPSILKIDAPVLQIEGSNGVVYDWSMKITALTPGTVKITGTTRGGGSISREIIVYDDGYVDDDSVPIEENTVLCYVKRNNGQSGREVSLEKFHFNYSLDECLAGSALNYNPQLAHMLIRLATSAYQGDNNDFNLIKNGRFPRKPLTITESLRNLGFSVKNEDIKEYNYFSDAFDPDYSEDSTAFTLAVKKAADGKEIISIVIRGSNGGFGQDGSFHIDWNKWASDWRSNTNFKNYGVGLHEGFNIAAEEIFSALIEFTSDKEIDVYNAKYVITGHSRGAAVANLVSKKLIDSGVDIEKVFDYNFACPDSGRDYDNSWNNNNRYGNIFNINNVKDIIGVIPGNIFNLSLNANTFFSRLFSVDPSLGVLFWGKYGNTYFFADDWNTIETTILGDPTLEHEPTCYVDFLAKEQSNESFKSWTEARIKLGDNCLREGVETIGKVIGLFCPVNVTIIEQNGAVLAEVVDGVPRYYNDSFGQVVILTAGDQSLVYLRNDCDYTVLIEGTDEGKLDYYTSDIVPKDTFWNLKYYENISLFSGKRIVNQIDITGAAIDTKLYVINDDNTPIFEIFSDGTEKELDESEKHLIISQNCGENIVWSLYDDGKIEIIGTGDMTGFSSITSVPWYPYRDLIKKIIIGEGITGISDYAFYGNDALEVSFPASITNIGNNAFTECDFLTDIYYAGSKWQWNERVSVGTGNECLLNANLICQLENLISDCDIFIETVNYTYDGNEKRPSVRVLFDGSELEEGKDYELSYSDNINAGQANITVSGLGIFTGNQKKTFTISKASQVVTAELASDEIGVDYATWIIASGIGRIRYESNNADIAEVDANGWVTGNSDGEAVITVTALGDQNHLSASAQVTIKVLSVYAVDSDSCGDNAIWTYYNDGTVVVTGTGKVELVKRPSGYCNWEQYFSSQWYEKVHTVIISEGITSIDDFVFAERGGSSEGQMDDSPKTIIIADSVTSIGGYAFYRCENLEYVILGSGLSSIGDYVFTYCPSLKKIEVADNNNAFQSIEGVLYSKDLSVLYKVPAGNISEYVIPEGVQILKSDSFGDILSLNAVSIPVSLKTVEKEAFDGSNNLKDVFYGGSKDEWDSIKVGFSNDVLLNADIHYALTVKAMTDCNVELPFLEYEYTGEELLPSVKVYSEENLLLTENVDYTINYKNNVNAGTGIVTISGIGSYTGEITKEFTITPKTISPKVVLSPISYTYDGSVKKPAVVVKDGDVVLESDNYTVTYASGGKEAGTYKVAVKMKGNYTGQGEASFKIDPAQIEKAIVTGITKQTFTGRALKPTPTVKLGAVQLKSGTDFVVSYKNNNTPGIAEVLIRGEGNYTGEITKEFLIQFSDVTNPDDFFYEPIYWAVENEITTGWDDGTFRPLNNCNRAAVVTFLWRLAGAPNVAITNAFRDLTGNMDFDKAISWAVAEGITTGWDDGTFRPWNTCNRAAIVTFLWRYAGKPGGEPAATFRDMTGNSDFDAAIAWAAGQKITTGYSDGTFRPWNTCNRLAVVSFLYRFANP